MSEKDVTKVDELRDLVAQSIRCEEWLHYLDEFEQAVRDEEWNLSCIKDGCGRYPGSKHHQCCTCPANGTRYCP